MPKMELTDKNGKVFDVDIADIMDIRTSPGYPISDDESDSVKPFDIVFTDYKGDLLNINTIMDSKQSMSDIAAIDVTFEATHSGVNNNDTIYCSDSMEKDAQTFLLPFPRPLIKNHNRFTDPLGRVLDATFKASVLNPSRNTIEVVWRVTDEESIPKFLDGRYRTMSIGGKANNIKCEICGKHIVKDGRYIKFCGHWKGQTYDDRECYWTLRDIEYYEGSVVNTPADDWAQIIAIKIITKSQLTEEKDSIEGGKTILSKPQIKSTDTNNSLETKNSSIADSIDDLLDSETEDNSNEASNEEEKDTSNLEDNIEEPEVDDSKEKVEDTEKSLKSKIKELETKVETISVFENKIKELESTIQTHANSIADAQKTNNELTEENELLSQQADTMKKQAVKLAVKIKDYLITKVIDHKISKGELKSEDCQSAIAKLKTKKASELEQMIKDFKNNTTTTHKVVTVQNPSLANPNEMNTITEDSKSDGDKQKPKAKTLKDMEDSLVDRFTM